MIYRERRSGGEAEGLMVLHHGRGADENDLLPLADVLDPDRRLHVVTPRAPQPFPGTFGYRWYEPRQVGYPDPDTFRSSYRLLAEFHDELWEQTGLSPEQTVLGGFSMGTAMSYAIGLGGDRPPPAGILALSGFIPSVDRWEPSLDDRQGTRVLIAHGRQDPVIPVTFGRAARELLEAGGLAVDYRESEAAHNIDPHDIPRIVGWMEQTLARR
ncbi:MAG: phospholipase [Actinomycetota bacterium]|nr:phospholipase [Actinomycetota bacterium]